jgi:hypothetical protein
VDFVVLLSNDVQLLEEMLDDFTTEPNILREMIAPPNIITNVVGSLTGRLNNPFLMLSFLNFFIFAT